MPVVWSRNIPLREISTSVEWQEKIEAERNKSDQQPKNLDKYQIKNEKIAKLSSKLSIEFPFLKNNEKIFEDISNELIKRLESENKFYNNAENTYKALFKNPLFDIDILQSWDRLYIETIIENYLVDIEKDDDTETTEDNTETTEDNTETTEDTKLEHKNDAIKTNNEIDQKQIKIDERLKNSQKMEKLYETTEKKYKGTPEEIAEFKTEFLATEQANKILPKLEFFDFNIDDYLNYLFTAKKFNDSKDTKNPKRRPFIESFKNLNKSLEIKINLDKIKMAYFLKEKEKKIIDNATKSAKISSFKDVTDTQIIENPNIQDFINSDKSNNESLLFEFSQDEIRDILSPYAKEDPELKKLLEHNIDSQWNIVIDSDNLSEVSHIKEKITSIIEQHKADIKERSERIVKERVMTTCFNALKWYFDTTNDNMENFSSMEIDTEKWIDMDWQEMSITWSINGKHIWLHYDLAAGTVKMDDFMAYSEQANGYVMWKWNGMKKTMEFTLPTYDTLLDDASSINISKIAKSSDDIDNFDDNLASDLDNKLSSNFGNKSFTQFFVERELEKNLLEQEIIWTIFTNRNKNNKDVDPIDVNNQKPVRIDETDPRYSLLRLINTTMRDTKDWSKLLKFRNSIKEFDNFINKKEIREWKSKDYLLNKLFNKKSMESSMENRKQKNKEDKTRDNKRLNYNTFFNRMKKPSKTWNPKINIDKFNLLTERLDKNQILEEAIDIPKDLEYNEIEDSRLDEKISNAKNIT